MKICRCPQAAALPLDGRAHLRIGESILLWAAAAAVRRADLLIIGGTSLTVYPAAGLASLFQGDCIAILNRDATPADRTAGIVIRDPVGEVLDAAVKAALHSSDP